MDIEWQNLLKKEIKMKPKSSIKNILRKTKKRWNTKSRNNKISNTKTRKENIKGKGFKFLKKIKN